MIELLEIWLGNPGDGSENGHRAGHEEDHSGVAARQTQHGNEPSAIFDQFRTGE